MQGLCFQVAGQRFALDCRLVVEVVPAIELRPLVPAMPPVQGLAAWRGRPLPVVDLGVLVGGAPCAARLSTRIIVARVAGAIGDPRATLVGLLAERVTEVVTLDEAARRELGVRLPDAPYLGGLMMAGSAMTQLLELSALLPERVLARLRPADGGGGGGALDEGDP